MRERLKFLWLRIVTPSFARALVQRIETLEAAQAATEKTVQGILRRFPQLGDPKNLATYTEVIKTRLSRLWPQRRAWLEATDAGRNLPPKGGTQ